MASELIGLDIGQARTGLARASTIARLAEPINSVPTDKLINELQNMMAESEVEAMVVGLPRNLNGEDTEQTRWVREFVRALQDQIKADFYWQDEALTSKKAEELKKRIKTKADDHALAATIILQDWIDTDEPERVRC